jgi:hypothetical protein
MKLTTLALALALAALCAASTALAKQQPTPGQTVLICHATHAKKHPYVLVRVPLSSAHARLKHGDVMPANGKCPGAPTTPVSTTTTSTTTS